MASKEKKKYEAPRFETLIFNAKSLSTQSGCVEDTVAVIVNGNECYTSTGQAIYHMNWEPD